MSEEAHRRRASGARRGGAQRSRAGAARQSTLRPGGDHGDRRRRARRERAADGHGGAQHPGRARRSSAWSSGCARCRPPRGGRGPSRRGAATSWPRCAGAGRGAGARRGRPGPARARRPSELSGRDGAVRKHPRPRRRRTRFERRSSAPSGGRTPGPAGSAALSPRAGRRSCSTRSRGAARGGRRARARGRRP